MRIIRTLLGPFTKMASATSTEADMSVYRLLCVVRGYHVYKAIWDPYLGDELPTLTLAVSTGISSSALLFLGLPTGRFTVFCPGSRGENAVARCSVAVTVLK